jgi:hypothetical protein
MVVASINVTSVAARPPILTLDVTVKFLPVIVMGVPPTALPWAGATELTSASGRYENETVLLDETSLVTTTGKVASSRRPEELGGVVTEMVVGLTKLKLVAATPPMVTLDVTVKFVPVIVIVVPPSAVPSAGDTAVTVGESAPEAAASGVVAAAVTPITITCTSATERAISTLR